MVVQSFVDWEKEMLVLLFEGNLDRMDQNHQMDQPLLEVQNLVQLLWEGQNQDLDKIKIWCGC